MSDCVLSEKDRELLIKKITDWCTFCFVLGVLIGSAIGKVML